jgi:nucleotide-binding universal stress UspA family protein
MSSSAKAPAIPALKNILFATDFSPCSEAAFPFLRELAARSSATIHVIHVLPPMARTAVPMDLAPELDVELTDAQDTIQLLLAGEAWQGISHTATVERGHVWEVLAAVAEEKHIDLIVLGTHGRQGLKKLVLGSTAEQVIRMATCPVLTVGPHVVQQAKAGFGVILCAADFSAGSQHALRYAASLARSNHSRLIVLHAVPPALEIPPGNIDAMPVNVAVSGEVIEMALANARRQLEELIAAESLQSLQPEIIVEGGPAVEIVLGVAQNKNAELIVMGAHRAWAHAMAGHLPWATAAAIIGEAPCPVLTVRD